jgi:Thioredoxin-like domain
MKQQLLAEANELALLKVWKLQELSLEAAKRLITSSKEKPIHMMAHLSQNNLVFWPPVGY